jgi:hypothetical protein
MGKRSLRSRSVPPKSLWRRLDFWAVFFAPMAVAAAVFIPYQIQKRIESNARAELDHQLVLSPITGTNDGLGYRNWKILLFVTNLGPAAVKTSITRIQTPMPMGPVGLASAPVLTVKSSAGQVVLGGAPERGWIEVAAHDVPPADGFALEAQFIVSESVRQEITTLWNDNMFSPSLVKRFVYFVSTNGENVVPRYSGAYPFATM